MTIRYESIFRQHNVFVSIAPSLLRVITHDDFGFMWDCKYYIQNRPNYNTKIKPTVQIIKPKGYAEIRSDIL